MPCIRRFSSVYKSLRFLKTVDLQGTAYLGSATLRRFKNPGSSTMLIGRMSLAIISHNARVSFFAHSEA